MAWGESKAWKKGTANQALYKALLEDAAQAPARNAKRKKVVHPEDMPWELSRHGLLKHLMNEGMNTRMETVDAYMLIIPPGSKSGRHRQLAEECLYVVEGCGYDIHVDYDVAITDTRWVKAEGLEIQSAIYQENLHTIELRDWASRGGRGVFLDHDASRTSNNAYVCEIPPGKQLAPWRHLFEEMIYVLDGRGSTTVWNDAGAQVTFEGMKGLIFAILLNTSHQHFT